MDELKSTMMALTDWGGMGPRTFQQLLLRMGSPDNFSLISEEDLRSVPRLSTGRAGRILESLDYIGEYETKLDSFNSMDIKVITFFDDDYPELLRKIGDPPPLIYVKGDLSHFDKKYVALVGTTQATQPGIRLTVDLTRELVSRGYGIISGLAIGIDSAAHLAALSSNGVTIAALGCGILSIYPEENISLADAIAKQGILISEYDPFKKVRAPQLILRNRLISALSEAVIVVQVGSTRRGELRTAQYAQKQGKPLFMADPEEILDRETIESAGALIIKDTGNVDDIIKYMV
jgi:DNA processing protein